MPAQFNFYQPIQMVPLQYYLNGPLLKRAPNNNIALEGTGTLDLIFASQFEWAPYNNI